MALANLGGRSNDATGKNVVLKAWQDRLDRLNAELDKLYDIAAERDFPLGNMAVIAKQEAEIKRHTKNKPL